MFTQLAAPAKASNFLSYFVQRAKDEGLEGYLCRKKENPIFPQKTLACVHLSYHFILIDSFIFKKKKSLKPMSGIVKAQVKI